MVDQRVPEAVRVLIALQRFRLPVERGNQKIAHAGGNLGQIEIVHQTRRVPRVSASPQRAGEVIIALERPAVEEQAGLQVAQIFYVHEELLCTLLHIFVFFKQATHAGKEQHRHIQRVVPQLLIVVGIDGHVLNAALGGARQLVHGVFRPLAADFQIFFVARVLPQEGQREAGGHAVHVLAGQTALDVLVEPFYQIIEGGLFAGLAPAAVNAE